jgi:hypothetical protein
MERSLAPLSQREGLGVWLAPGGWALSRTETALPCEGGNKKSGFFPLLS